MHEWLQTDYLEGVCGADLRYVVCCREESLLGCAGGWEGGSGRADGGGGEGGGQVVEVFVEDFDAAHAVPGGGL